MDFGADVNAKKPDTGMTPLMNACFYGDLEGVNELLHHHADPNVSNVRGWTPLMMALRRGGPDLKEIVEELLSYGAEVNVSDFSGMQTPRSLARELFLPEIEDLL